MQLFFLSICNRIMYMGAVYILLLKGAIKRYASCLLENWGRLQKVMVTRMWLMGSGSEGCRAICDIVSG